MINFHCYAYLAKWDSCMNFFTLSLFNCFSSFVDLKITTFQNTSIKNYIYLYIDNSTLFVGAR